MNHKQQNTKKGQYAGVTLIETLVYVAIFGLIFLSVIQFLFASLESNVTTQGRIKAEKSKIFISQHFESSFSRRDEISINSIFNDGSCLLQLNISQVMDSGIVYSLNNSQLVVSRAELPGQPITPKDMIVTSFGCSPIINNNSEIIGASLAVTFYLDDRRTAEDTFSMRYLFR